MVARFIVLPAAYKTNQPAVFDLDLESIVLAIEFGEMLLSSRSENAGSLS